MKYFIFKNKKTRLYLTPDRTWSTSLDDASMFYEEAACQVAADVRGQVVDVLKELYREQPNNLTKAKP